MTAISQKIAVFLWWIKIRRYWYLVSLPNHCNCLQSWNYHHLVFACYGARLGLNISSQFKPWLVDPLNNFLQYIFATIFWNFGANIPRWNVSWRIVKIVAHAKNEISSFQTVGLNLVSSLCCHGRLPLGPRMKEVDQLVGQKFAIGKKSSSFLLQRVSIWWHFWWFSCNWPRREFFFCPHKGTNPMQDWSINAKKHL